MKKFFKAVAIVGIFNVLERIIGFVYRVFLSRQIGAEGLGIYQIAVSVFAVLLALTTSGIPVTVSRSIAKRRATGDMHAERNIVSAGFFLCVAISLPVFLIAMFFNKQFSFLFSDERVLPVFTILMPALIFSSVYSTIRGYFWGKQDYIPYSLVEFIEEISMVVIGIILVSFSSSAVDGASKAALALMLSYLISFACAVIFFIAKKGRLGSPYKMIKPIALTALPITGVRVSATMISSLIAVLLPLRLIYYGMKPAEAISQFGASYGMSFTLLFLPITIIGSVALVLVPELSEDLQKKDFAALNSKIEKAIKFAVVISCFLIPVYFVFGKEIGIILYDNEFSGVFLSYASILLLPMCMSQISTSLLNSLGMERRTLISYFIGAALMLICIIFMPKYMGIYSLILGLLLCYTVNAVIDLIFMRKVCRPKYIKFLICASLFTIPTVMITQFIFNILNSYSNAFLAMVIASGVSMVFNFSFYLVFGFVRLRFAEITKVFKRGSERGINT